MRFIQMRAIHTFVLPEPSPVIFSKKLSLDFWSPKIQQNTFPISWSYIRYFNKDFTASSPFWLHTYLLHGVLHFQKRPVENSSCLLVVTAFLRQPSNLACRYVFNFPANPVRLHITHDFKPRGSPPFRLWHPAAKTVSSAFYEIFFPVFNQRSVHSKRKKKSFRSYYL